MKKSELRNLTHEIYGEMDKRKFRMMDGNIVSVDKVMQNEYLSVAYQGSKLKKGNANPSILIPISHFTSTGDPLPKVGDKCSGKFYGGDGKFGGGKVIYFCWADKYCWEPDKKFDAKEEISSMSNLEKFEKLLKSHDWYYMMSDSIDVYNKGDKEEEEIRDIAIKLKDVPGAKELWNKYSKPRPYTKGDLPYPTPYKK